MKTIYKIILFTFILQTNVFSQFEVLSIVKPSGNNACDGKINLKFEESELPYTLTATGLPNPIEITTTIYTLKDLCPGTISINAVDNHGCDETKDVELEECGDIDVSFEQIGESECKNPGTGITVTVNEGEDLVYSWSNGANTKDLDGDLYPDYWEDHDFEAKLYGFHSGDPSDHFNYPSGSGYKYEEDKCRQVEHNLIETKYDNKDWSFDYLNKFQGKQWK